MDFKIGDIVHIRGGVDEWEVVEVINQRLTIVATFNEKLWAQPLQMDMKLVRRPVQYNKQAQGLINSCNLDVDKFENLPKKKVELEPNKRDEAPKTGQGNVIDFFRYSSFPKKCDHISPPKESVVKKQKVERWLWVLKSNYSNDYFHTSKYKSDEEIKASAIRHSCTIIGRDPNCIIPLITEE